MLEFQTLQGAQLGESSTRAGQTPRDRRRERTRRAILDAARDLLAERGHEKLSLREIARRADYSPAALYEYFESKKSIVSALADRAGRPLADRLRRAVELGRRSHDGPLVALGLAYITYALENKEDFLLLSSRLGATRSSPGKSIPADSPYRIAFEEVVRQIVCGVLGRRSKAAEQMAYGLWALAHGLAMLQLTNLAGLDADFAAADRNALRAYVSGLCSSGESSPAVD